MSVTFMNIVVGVRTHLFHNFFPQIPKDTRTCSCGTRTGECILLHFCKGTLNTESVNGE